MTKHIVFDLDNTIGFFSQYIYVLNIIEKINKKSLTEIEIHELLIYFENIFRPMIFDIFELILFYRDKKLIKTIILYTNNVNDYFVNCIINYINKKLNSVLFDKIITASHNNRSYKKTLEDLCKCVPFLNSHSKICFIDDKYHKGMDTNNIIYIKCKPYYYYYEKKEIYKMIKNKFNITKENVKDMKFKNEHHYPSKNIYDIISIDMIGHIRSFILN